MNPRLVSNTSDNVSLFPFLRNLKKNSNVGAGKILEKQYLGDNFHISAHTSETCDLASD